MAYHQTCKKLLRYCDEIDNPEDFCNELTTKMRYKIKVFNNLLTPDNGILKICSSNILPYWGQHNISPNLLSESNSINIKILPDCELFKMFEHLPTATKRDSYHYHMLKKGKVNIIFVGDANYKKNICSCKSCATYDCETIILTDKKRKELLNLV